MPFDIALPQDVQNLLTLADALEREHEGFRWDYYTFHRKADCGTAGCALGVAIHIGMLPEMGEHPGGLGAAAANAFGMSLDELNRVFTTPQTYGTTMYSKVTPSMVAAELRRIAAEKMGANRTAEVMETA